MDNEGVEQRIEEWALEGRSFAWIVDELRASRPDITESVVANWCRRRGIHPRHQGDTGAGK